MGIQDGSIQDTKVGIVPFDHESITIDDSVGGIGLTAGTYADAIHVEMTLERSSIRVCVDGTAPTTSVGHVIDAWSRIILDGTAEIAGFRAIRMGDVSGILKATYYH